MSEPKVVCSACHRPMPGKARCMYCGGVPMVLHTMVIGPEVADPRGAIERKIAEIRAPLTPEQREALFNAKMDELDALVSAGRHEDAMPVFDQGLALKRNPHLMVAKAVSLKVLGRLPLALQCLDDALAVDASLVDAWFERADMLETIGHLPESLEAYDRVLALEPRHARAWSDRGHVLNRMGRVAEALSSYESALAVDPSMIYAWFNKANAEMGLGKPAAAKASFRHFLALAPPPHMAAQVEHARRALAKLGP